jgi:hypothetical protein
MGQSSSAVVVVIVKSLGTTNRTPHTPHLTIEFLLKSLEEGVTIA